MPLTTPPTPLVEAHPGGSLLLGGIKFMVAFSKPPETILQHIERLKSRGMQFNSEEFAKSTLNHITYYRLCAYWLPCVTNVDKNRFKANTKFEDVVNHYEFDRSLRLLILDAVERVEISIRTNWVNVVKMHYGPHGHCNSEGFNLQRDGKKKITWSQPNGIAKLVIESGRSKETYVKHFRKKYDEILPPIWASAELMTFGAFSTWYKNTRKRQIRNEIAKTYLVDETILTSYLHHLVTVRNFCAHHARVWNRSFTFSWSLPRKAPEALLDSLEKSDDKRKKIYNTLVMLSHLMHLINPDTQWHNKLIELIDDHDIETAHMGFPENYKTLPIWQ